MNQSPPKKSARRSVRSRKSTFRYRAMLDQSEESRVSINRGNSGFTSNQNRSNVANDQAYCVSNLVEYRARKSCATTLQQNIVSQLISLQSASLQQLDAPRRGVEQTVSALKQTFENNINLFIRESGQLNEKYVQELADLKAKYQVNLNDLQRKHKTAIENAKRKFFGINFYK